MELHIPETPAWQIPEELLMRVNKSSKTTFPVSSSKTHLVICALIGAENKFVPISRLIDEKKTCSDFAKALINCPDIPEMLAVSMMMLSLTLKWWKMGINNSMPPLNKPV